MNPCRALTEDVLREVAILAFRAVYELELKRRENDKKILAVYGDMRDMMAALAQYVPIFPSLALFFSRLR